MPTCSICKSLPATEKITILDETFELCGFDALKLRTFAHGSVYQDICNINWGAGRIGWNEWYAIRDFLRSKGIKEVLEFGSGLSSELFVIEGMKLVSFDELEVHINILKNLSPTKEKASFHYYPHDTIPNVKEVYPNRKWDFIFVDGPHRRAREVALAMELSNKYICLHDPNLGEEEFFPGTTWREVSNRIYERIE
jgi:hypothetical protein